MEPFVQKVFTEPRVFTTAEIQCGHVSDIELLKNIPGGWNLAALFVDDFLSITCKNNFYTEYCEEIERDHKRWCRQVGIPYKKKDYPFYKSYYVRKANFIFKTPDNKEYDYYYDLYHDTGRWETHGHAYGYQYNMLDCFIEFLNCICEGSSIVDVQGGDNTVKVLKDILNPKTSDWPCSGDNKRKLELIDKVNTICKEKNITIDLRPIYLLTDKIELVSTQKHHKVKPYEGDEYYEIVYTYKITYKDGRVEYEHGYEWLIRTLKENNLPVPEISEDVRISSLHKYEYIT